MAGIKNCSGCLTTYDDSHWAYNRETCPACGGKLLVPAVEKLQPAKAHYDSSLDIKFDFANLLSPEQRREVLAILIGFTLLVLTFIVRLLFVILGGIEGFWKVPLWLDGLVMLMLGLGVVMMSWSVRRWWLHFRDTRQTR